MHASLQNIFQCMTELIQNSLQYVKEQNFPMKDRFGLNSVFKNEFTQFITCTGLLRWKGETCG